MKTNSKMVELSPDLGYLIMDKERHNIFNKVLCSVNDVDNFIEVEREEAIRLNNEYIMSMNVTPDTKNESNIVDVAAEEIK